jgi:adenosylhomocysteinase
MGAHVLVTEVEPVRALEAVMDGFPVLPMAAAAAVGDIFITVTGNIHAIGRSHLEAMKDGAILANSGHFNVEIDIAALEAMARSHRTARPLVEEYTLRDGRRLYLLGEGRLINLAAAEGHPASVMDMSFANQAFSVVYLAREAKKLERRVYQVPPELDAQVARLKLDSMGIAIDAFTEEQQKYLKSWQEGT